MRAGASRKSYQGVPVNTTTLSQASCLSSRSAIEAAEQDFLRDSARRRRLEALQDTIDQPRSFAFDGLLTLESMIPAPVRDDLVRRGHHVRWSEDPIGGCQAIWIDHARGILLGASDHRKDSIALGY